MSSVAHLVTTNFSTNGNCDVDKNGDNIGDGDNDGDGGGVRCVGGSINVSGYDNGIIINNGRINNTNNKKCNIIGQKQGTTQIIKNEKTDFISSEESNNMNKSNNDTATEKISCIFNSQSPQIAKSILITTNNYSGTKKNTSFINHTKIDNNKTTTATQTQNVNKTRSIEMITLKQPDKIDEYLIKTNKLPSSSSSTPRTSFFSSDDNSTTMSNYNANQNGTNNSIRLRINNDDNIVGASTNHRESTVVIDRQNKLINNNLTDATKSIFPASTTLSSNLSTATATTTTASIKSTRIQNDSDKFHGLTIKLEPADDDSVEEETIQQQSTLFKTKQELISSPSISMVTGDHLNPSKIESYLIGDDVLVLRKLKDEKFHLGQIIEINKLKYKIRFRDNVDDWYNLEELKKLNLNENILICIVCKNVNNNEINVEPVMRCEKCSRGYHLKCADVSTTTTGSVGDGNDVGPCFWICRRGHRNLVKNFNNSKIENSPIFSKTLLINQDDDSQISKTVKQLPYELNRLKWDKYHLENSNQTYCYCGENGLWYMQMLQCDRCQQWFHESCLEKLQFPIYCGDRFYVFKCLICNNGKEYLRRQILRMDELVHLLLFNLTINNHEQFYDATRVIVPYAVDNWHAIQLPPKLKDLSFSDMKEKILKSLNSCDNIFIRHPKYKTHFGLRIKEPPAHSQTFKETRKNLPKSVTCDFKADDAKLRLAMTGKSHIGIFSTAAASQSDQDESAATESNDDDKFESDDDEVLANFANSAKRAKLNSSNNCIHSTINNSSQSLPPTPPTSLSRPTSPNGFCGLDSDKDSEDTFTGISATIRLPTSSSSSSAAAPSTTTITSTAVQKRKRGRPSNGKIPRTTNIGSLKCRNNSAGRGTGNAGYEHLYGEYNDSSDDTSSRGTLDLIIPPPKDFQGFNNPFLSHITKIRNENDVTSGTGVKTTVPLSCSLSSITKQLSSSSSSSSSILNGPTISNNTSNRQYVNPATSSQISSLFGKFSSSTSNSKIRIVRTVKRQLSAKDIKIGPNMEVKRRKLRRKSGNFEIISTGTIHTLSKSASYLPIRTDLKDVSISAIRSSLTSASGTTILFSNIPNQSHTPHTTTTTTASSATYQSPMSQFPTLNSNPLQFLANTQQIPLRPATTRLSSTASVTPKHGRRLRKRVDTNYSENPRRNSISIGGNTTNMTANGISGIAAGNLSFLVTPPMATSLNNSVASTTSPSKNNSGVTLTELQSTLTMYFGAANRIANGERFIIKGKRIGADGKSQYLIEWEGVS